MPEPTNSVVARLLEPTPLGETGISVAFSLSGDLDLHGRGGQVVRIEADHLAEFEQAMARTYFTPDEVEALLWSTHNDGDIPMDLCAAVVSANRKLEALR